MADGPAVDPTGAPASVRVVLASASPRRRDLLRRIGVDPEVRPVDVDETPRAGESGEELARRLAADKCAASDAGPDALVIAADTVVVVDGDPLGKPEDDADARTMLARLSGRRHQVLTGVAVRRRGRTEVDVVATEVVLRDLTTDEVAAYVATGEPADKAGAYAIQGRAGAFVTEIHGSDSNVVGLPLAQTVALARRVGVDLLDARSPADGPSGA